MGYPPSNQHLLTPYHEARYHLAKWSRANQKSVTLYYIWPPLMNIFRPCMKEELFNLHHASAHNVIEWIFGVLKWKFHILHLPPEYSLRHILQLHSLPFIILLIAMNLRRMRMRMRIGKGMEMSQLVEGSRMMMMKWSGLVGKWTRHEVGWYCDCNVGAMCKQTYYMRAPHPWDVNTKF